jgi:hypothetical protein
MVFGLRWLPKRGGERGDGAGGCGMRLLRRSEAGGGIFRFHWGTDGRASNRFLTQSVRVRADTPLPAKKRSKIFFLFAPVLFHKGELDFEHRAALHPSPFPILLFPNFATLAPSGSEPWQRPYVYCPRGTFPRRRKIMPSSRRFASSRPRRRRRRRGIPSSPLPPTPSPPPRVTSRRRKMPRSRHPPWYTSRARR